MSKSGAETILLIALCLGFFMVIMDTTIVNVALPQIASGLSTSISDLQWVIAGYTLTFASLLLCAGYLADQLGAKKTLIAGLTMFVLASLACGLAAHPGLLIVFRLIQGAAAASLIPSSLALINLTYPDQRQRAKAIGIWGGIGGLAAACGPLMGALLTASLTWRGVFFVNIPVGLVAILLVNSFTTHSIVKTHKQFDLSGQLLGILVIASLAFSLIEAGRYGWQATQVIIPLIIFIISLMAFIWVENRVAQPVLPLTFFANKHFTIVMTVGLFLNLGVYGELFLLPLYFQQVRGYSVLTAGFAIFPLVALIGISSFLSGKLVSYKGAKLPLCLGLIIGALGFLGLLTIGQNSPDYYWLILPLAAIGSGIAFAMPAATVIAIQAVPKERAGMASATFTTSRQLGSLLGVAIFGTILASTSDFVTGMRITLVIAGLLFMLGLVLAYFIGPHASAHH